MNNQTAMYGPECPTESEAWDVSELRAFAVATASSLSALIL